MAMIRLWAAAISPNALTYAAILRPNNNQSETQQRTITFSRINGLR
jgi:hypothetical protein